MKRFFSVFLLIILLGAPLGWAQTFSVSILEDSRGDDSPALSEAVLDGCLDYLFASGLIATNESVGRVEESVFRSRGYGMASAREGFVDFAAFVWIRYVSLAGVPDVTVPEIVRWRIVRVRDESVLEEGTTPPPQYEEMTADERKKVYMDFGRSLADLWAKALWKDRG